MKFCFVLFYYESDPVKYKTTSTIITITNTTTTNNNSISKNVIVRNVLVIYYIQYQV